MGIRFEWDSDKSKKNLLKHKVSFEDACTIFGDPFALTILDHEHSDNENREITLGMSQNVILLVVCHTDRSGRIRIISARRATKSEERQYQENRR